MIAMRWGPASAGLLLCLGISAQDALPPETLLLARIRARAAENLQRLPNYTCTETIERSRRGRKSRKFELVDTLRLEVALVDGKEMFAWPGAGKFEEKDIGDMVGHGAAIGNGNFALHARSVFLSGAPTFTRGGESLLNGLTAIHYDYRVPQMLSRYLFRVGSKQATVAYHGSFWVEPETLDLMRLEVRAENFPPDLDLLETSDSMEYQRVRIGEADFLLPESSELIMIDLLGNESRNRTRLTACRQYAGESVLHFDDEPITDAVSPAPQTKEIRLPAGLIVELQLQTPIQSSLSAIGDPVKALVSRDVKKDGKILAPKGAVLTGRITHLEKRQGQFDYYIVGLEFSTIEFDNGRGDFRASLKDPGLAQVFRGRSGRLRDPLQWQVDAPSSDGSSRGGMFAMPGSKISLRRGHFMVWRTEP